MKILRIDRNINGVMAMPGMQQAAIDRMLGATETVFGPPRQIEAQPAAETIAAESEPPEEDDFPPETPAPAKERTPEDSARDRLQEYLDRKLPEKGGWKTACDLIRAMIANKDSTLEAMNNLIDRTEVYLSYKIDQRKAGTA